MSISSVKNLVVTSFRKLSLQLPLKLFHRAAMIKKIKIQQTAFNIKKRKKSFTSKNLRQSFKEEALGQNLRQWFDGLIVSRKLKIDSVKLLEISTSGEKSKKHCKYFLKTVKTEIWSFSFCSFN